MSLLTCIADVNISNNFRAMTSGNSKYIEKRWMWSFPSFITWLYLMKYSDSVCICQQKHLDCSHKLLSLAFHMVELTLQLIWLVHKVKDLTQKQFTWSKKTIQKNMLLKTQTIQQTNQTRARWRWSQKKKNQEQISRKLGTLHNRRAHRMLDTKAQRQINTSSLPLTD